jgi:hypothetical protein
LVLEDLRGKMIRADLGEEAVGVAAHPAPSKIRSSGSETC